jgi:hypothetical protein
MTARPARSAARSIAAWTSASAASTTTAGELVADDPHPTPLVDAAARAVDVGQRDLDRAHRGAEATERERQAAADVVAQRGR